MNEIIGYKSVDKNYKDISGNILEENKIYHVDGKIILSLFKQSADGELAIYCRNIYR